MQRRTATSGYSCGNEGTALRGFAQTFLLALVVASGCAPAPSPVVGSKSPPTENTDVTAAASAGAPSDREEREIEEESVVQVDAPSRDRTVSIGAALFPGQAAAGASVTLAVRVRLASGWHMGAVGDGSSEEGAATVLDLQLPPGIETAGEWQLPASVIQSGPQGRSAGYEGDVTFRRKLRISADQPAGALELACTVTCQVCNAMLCKRPAPMRLKTPLQVIHE